ncbi:MAG: hypothetical protein ACK4K9_00025 [Bacteroidia bacterium]
MPVGIYTGNVRYSLNSSWSFEAKFTTNNFFNNNTGNAFDPNATLTDGFYKSNELLSYNTALRGLHGIAYYNLGKLLGIENNPTNNWAPYINFGGGLQWFKLSSLAIDGKFAKMEKFFNVPWRDYQLGLGTKYFINSNLDLNLGVEYHYVETYYLDMAGADQKLDNFINFYLGAQYKFGSKPWRNTPEWKFKDMEYQGEDESYYTKWSADANVGMPVMFSPVGYKFTGMFGLGARHSFSKSFALGAYYNYGALGASQNVSLPSGTPITFKPQEVKKAVSYINQFSLRGFINIPNLRNAPEVRPNWNHYAVIGFGMILANSDVEYANGISNSYKIGTGNDRIIRTPLLGYQARKYINKNIDWSMGVDYSRNESRWLDGGHNKTTNNGHLYFYSGIAYKFGNSDGNRENIDWSYKGYTGQKRERQIPMKEVPLAKEQPKEESRVVEIPTEPIKEAPKEEKPVVVEPIVPTQEKVVVQVQPPVKQETLPIQQPVVEKKDEPKTKPRPIIVDKPKAEPNEGDEVTTPPMIYNVIVACYTTNNVNSAIRFKKELEGKGYKPSLYRSNPVSKIIRVSILSTDNRAEAFAEWRKARKEIEPTSWIHLYNKQ